MSGRWEFTVQDANDDDRVLSFSAAGGAVRVSSPRTWKADADTYREILSAWSEACDMADRQRGVPPS